MIRKALVVVALVGVGCGQSFVEDDGPSDATSETPVGMGGDASADAGRDASADAHGDAHSDAGRDSPSDAPTDVPVDAPADAPADTERDAPADTGKDAPADTGRDAPADTGRDAPADTGKDAPADTGKDAPGMDVGVDAPSDTGIGSDAGAPWSPVCLEQEPIPGVTSCANEGLLCEDGLLQYDVGCDLVLECSGGFWVKDSTTASYGCVPDGPNSSECPASYAAITGSVTDSCLVDNLRCQYPEGVCVCSRSLGVVPIMLVDGGVTSTWSCDPGPSCPMPRPRLGATCESSAAMSTTCIYQSCEFAEACVDGYWQQEGVLCAALAQ